MLIQILKQYNLPFCIVNDGEYSDAILALPYSPFANYPKNCARIDSFYIVSNKLYLIAKQIKQKLKDEGFLVVERELQLKKVGEKGGFGQILHNQLLTNLQFGSRMTLQAVSVKGKYEYKFDGNFEINCNFCEKCTKICPANALNFGCFDRNKCIRHKQDFPENFDSVVQSRVLGCEECQNACPYNLVVKKVEMPDEVKKVFCYDNLFDMLKLGKKAMQPLAELIGSNYARSTFIFNLIVNSLLASNNFDYTQKIATFSNHNSDKIRDKVDFYMECYQKHLATKFDKN